MERCEASWWGMTGDAELLGLCDISGCSRSGVGEDKDDLEVSSCDWCGMG